MRTLRITLLSALLAAAPAAAQTAVPPGLEVYPTPGIPAAEVARLRSDVERVVRAMGSAPRTGVLVVSVERGDTLVSLNADVPLAPASNMKLYSTAAALYYLGPDFRFSTHLLADGPVRDGALEGDLILYGTGDPSISGRMLPSGLGPFVAFADALAAQGVTRVRGDVVGDGSWFDDEWVGDAWNPSDLMQWYGAPVGALSFSENMVTVRVQPTAAGLAARVTTNPATVGMAIENRVRTVSGGRTSLRFEHGDSGIVVTGQIRRDAGTMTRFMPVVDPADYSAAVLRAVLQERGIRVEGETRSVRRADQSRLGPLALGPAAPPRVLAVHRSPTLSEIASVTNHVSHNLFADALLKAAGRAAVGEGSFAGGARAVRRMLGEETGLDPAVLSIEDGSGLARTNRVTARSTIDLLDYMRRGGAWDPYFQSLPGAAEPGGLRRMQGTPAARNLRAKTGTIRNVSALSGYVRSADGELLMFSIITNGIPVTARAKQAEDQIGARLARFSRRG